MKKIVLPLLSLFILLSHANGRTWTNQEGRTFEGVIAEVNDNNVSIRRALDRRKFTMPIKDLSEADQAYIKKFLDDKSKQDEPENDFPETEKELEKWLTGKIWEVEANNDGKISKSWIRLNPYNLSESSKDGKVWTLKNAKWHTVSPNSFQFGTYRYIVTLDVMYRKFSGQQDGGMQRKIKGKLVRE